MMERECGRSTTPMPVRRTQKRIAPQPKQTSPFLTPLTVTQTKNDGQARVKCTLGSGWSSLATTYGGCYLVKWA